MKQGLFIAASMAALMAAMPAQAQEAAAVEAEGEIIVVTAQKRVEALQDVPISITVVNGEALREQGAGSLVDYAGYVPGMTVISSQPGTSIISLRGIAPVGSAQAVGIYLDDAPVGSSSLYARSATYSLDLMPYDIAGLEILRGPQGTLYGASSIGGLLKYRTVAPSTTDFSVKAGGELFTIDQAGNPGWAAQVMVNAPIIQDKLGITGSFSWRKTPGYVSSVNNPALNDANDVEQRGGRVSLLWNATEDFTVRLGGIWQTIDANATNAVVSTAAGVPLGDGWSYNSFLPEPFRKSIDYYSAVLDYDLGFATLTSVSTYSETSTVSVQDASLVFGVAFDELTGGAVADGLSPFSVALDLQKFTQEIRLASPSNDRFEWLIGAFYTKEESENHQLVRTLDFSGAPNALDPGAVVSLPSTFKEMAVFVTRRTSRTSSRSAAARSSAMPTSPGSPTRMCSSTASARSSTSAKMRCSTPASPTDTAPAARTSSSLAFRRRSRRILWSTTKSASRAVWAARCRSNWPVSTWTGPTSRSFSRSAA